MNTNMVSSIDPLELLNRVNTFYEMSWNHLLLYSTLLVTVIGIIIPILIQFFQTRALRKEEAAINARIDQLIAQGRETLRDTLQKDVASHKATLEGVIAKFDEKLTAQEDRISKQHEETVKTVKSELTKNIARTSGSVFHVQGLMLSKNEDYVGALRSLMNAAAELIEAEDELNLRRVMNIMRDDCLPFITKNEIAMTPTIRDDFGAFIKNLRRINAKGGYSDDIANIDRAFKLASEREPKKALEPQQGG